jgi:hypothetical protein
MAVETPNLEYVTMSTDFSWNLIEALMGGTKTMREAKTEFLPQETKEKPDDYTKRLNRSFLTNGYKDTINKATAKPFEKIATVKFESEDVEARMRPILDNMDGKGTDFNQYAENFYKKMTTWGLAHSHTDFPKPVEKKDDNGEPRDRTSQDDIDDNLRPINRILDTPSVIGWRKESGDNGIPFISEVRIHEVIFQEKEDEKWVEERIDQIRVLRKDEFEIWQKKKEDKEYIEKPQLGGKISGIDDIPIVTAYADELIDLYVAEPPFLELAWLNLKHWQSDSDQRNGLRFARFNLPFVAGMKPEEMRAGLVFAPNMANGSENENAKATILEGNGVGLELGNKDIEHIEAQMAIMGWQIMAQRLANVKVNPQMAGEQKGVARIKMWVQAIKKALIDVVILNAEWMNIELTEDDFTLDIFTDFTVGMFGADDFKFVEHARDNGDLTRKTYLEEMQRYDILTEDVDAEEEAKAAGDESVDGLSGLIGNQDAGNDITVPEGQELINQQAQEGIGTTIADDIG